MAGRTLARVALCAAAAAALACPVTARAEPLQRLTVQAFSLSADTSRPNVDVPFHLIVTLRVREQVTEIDNLELPMLAELELLGDERRMSSDSSGTLYRETIAVVAHRTGSIVIAPAMLQAIDAHDGRAKQWSTNGLTLTVGGISAQTLRERQAWLLAAARVAAIVALWIVGVLCAIGIVVLLLRRRRKAPVVPPPPIESPPPAPPRSRRAQVDDALLVLRAERTRAAAIRVRGAIWRMIGASEGETLADVLRRPEAADPQTRNLLRALERSAFTYDDDLRGAIEDACDALEQYPT